MAVARALVLRPVLLLADEPTGNLDRRTAQAVGELLLELHRQERTILVVVTHSPELARLFPRRMEMDDGTMQNMKCQCDAATRVGERSALPSRTRVAASQVTSHDLHPFAPPQSRVPPAGNLAVLLGVAVGTAVLTGALLVGDSLRGSLRDRALRQLGMGRRRRWSAGGSSASRLLGNSATATSNAASRLRATVERTDGDGHAGRGWQASPSGRRRPI